MRGASECDVSVDHQSGLVLLQTPSTCRYRRRPWRTAEGKPCSPTTLKDAASRQDPGDRQRGYRRPGSRSVDILDDMVLEALGFGPKRRALDLVRSTTDRLTFWRRQRSRSTSAGYSSPSAAHWRVRSTSCSRRALTDDRRATSGLLQEGRRLYNRRKVASAVGELFALDEPPLACWCRAGASNCWSSSPNGPRSAPWSSGWPSIRSAWMRGRCSPNSWRRTWWSTATGIARR